MIRKKKKTQRKNEFDCVWFSRPRFFLQKAEFSRLFKLEKKTFLEQFLCTNEKS